MPDILWDYQPEISADPNFSRVETREVCALPAVHRLNPMTKKNKRVFIVVWCLD